MLKRSNSLPEVMQGESLMEELGIDEAIRVDTLERHEVALLQRLNARTNKVTISHCVCRLYMNYAP